MAVLFFPFWIFSNNQKRGLVYGIVSLIVIFVAWYIIMNQVYLVIGV